MIKNTFRVVGDSGRQYTVLLQPASTGVDEPAHAGGRYAILTLDDGTPVTHAGGWNFEIAFPDTREKASLLSWQQLNLIFAECGPLALAGKPVRH